MNVRVLKKQIPIKPIIRCYYENKEKEWNQSQKSHKYCVGCGQKLKWE